MQNNDTLFFPWGEMQTEHIWNENILPYQIVETSKINNTYDDSPILMGIFCLLIYDIILVFILTFKK